MSKIIVIRIFYLISGVFLFSSTLILLNTYLFRLKVETAVVNAQIETLVSPVGGYISDVFVTDGARVRKGDKLVKIENLYLERKLQLARVQVAESTLNTDYYQQLLDHELQRLTIYQIIGHHRVVASEAMVKASKQTVMTAQQHLQRISTLHAKHYVSNALLEDNQAMYAHAQEQLKKAQSLYHVEKHSLNNALNHGMYFSGTKTEGISQDLTAKLAAAKQQTTLNIRRVKIYQRLIDKLTLVAPFDGKVTHILKSPGNTTDNIKPLMFIEKTTEHKNINAYLTQDEIIHLSSSGKTTIYLPSSGTVYHGNIIEINRTDGFIDEVKAQYRWRDFQVDRSAMVTIGIQASEKEHFDTHAFPGMPAIVYFSKKNIFRHVWM